MKKALCLCTFILLLFSGCGYSFSAIDSADVEKMIVWTHESRRELSEEEISGLMAQYNASSYGGKATGEGGTPDFGIKIVLRNGKELFVNDFYGKVEVIGDDRSFYLENPDLYKRMKEAAYTAG